MSIHTSLLRERFIIREDVGEGQAPVPAFEVASNRIEIELVGKTTEHFIVRAQTMHICVRMAMRIIQSFNRLGALMNRTDDHNWKEDWKAVLSDYERFHNPHIWCCVYFEGREVFSFKEHHIFLDLIEKCSYGHEGPYDEAIPMAQKLLSGDKRVLHINHQSNVALTIDLDKDGGKCGIINRGPKNITTFSIHIKPAEGQYTINLPQAVGCSAAFLEAIQLCYFLGIGAVKLEYGIFERFSPEEKQLKEARERLKRLRYEISNFESTHIVRYRPEQPNFDHLMAEAEALGRQTLTPAEDGAILSEEERQALKKAQNSHKKKTEEDISSLLQGEDGKMFT